MLEIRDLDAGYGRIKALRGVSLNVAEGEVVSLVGSNGAGKTSLLSVISGLIRPGSGALEFMGEAIHRLRPPAIVRRGIIQVPEGRQLFGPLTVMENLEMGAYHRFGRTPKDELYDEIDKIFKLFPILAERRNQAAGTLSGGEQQMLAMGRGMMGAPKLLLLDEPSLGLAPLVVSEIFRIIKMLKEQGTTILLVEQNARGALSVSDRAYVLETGRITMSGKSCDLMDDPAVKRAFLGRMRKE